MIVVRSTSRCITRIVVHVLIAYTKSHICTGICPADALAVRFSTTSVVHEGGILYIWTFVLELFVSMNAVFEYLQILAGAVNHGVLEI